MMKLFKKFPQYLMPLAISFLILAIIGCSVPGPGGIARIPIFRVHIEVVDEADQPIPGAIVESADGQTATADSEGKASIRFGSVGIHMVTVMTDNRVPYTFTLSMPIDAGKTFTARLGKPVEFTGPMILGGLGFWQLATAQLYPFLLSSMFSAYGYNIDIEDYAQGEWTEWRISTEENDRDPLLLRKAFLAKLDNGQEWWQVRFAGDSEDDGAYIIEVLFSEDRGSVRRIRQKIGDEEPQETPVSEGWYYPPMKLTGESLEGAVAERNVSVSVPAGTFSADLMRFAISPGMDLRIWRYSNVPGGVIKYETKDDEDGLYYRGELLGHGTGATTELGSF